MNLFLKLIFFKYTRIVLSSTLESQHESTLLRDSWITRRRREQSPFIAADVNIAH